MKKSYLNDIAMGQAHRRVESLREIKKEAEVEGGWIKFMRKALGLTLNDLSQLVSLTPANVAQTEKREKEGKVSVTTLKKMAQAMECELVYSFVPKKEIKKIIHDRAYDKAKRALRRADFHMALENQKVMGDEEERIENLAKKLIEKGNVW